MVCPSLILSNNCDKPVLYDICLCIVLSSIELLSQIGINVFGDKLEGNVQDAIIGQDGQKIKTSSAQAEIGLYFD